MSTAILADGSLIVRLAWQTVHLDVRTRAIHLRSPQAGDALEGDILESFPQVAADRVRIVRGPEERHHLIIELRSGRSLSLGHASTHERAMITARLVADLTRCKLEVSEGTVQALPGPSQAFSRGVTMEQDLSALLAESDPFDDPTHLMVWEDSTDVAGASTAPAMPRPRAKTSIVAPKTEIVIRDDEEDPLDYTMCRPASSGEAAMRVAESNEDDPA